MSKVNYITPESAKNKVKRAIAGFTSVGGYAVIERHDEENEETMLIFYEPHLDYCVNVQITENLHGNEARRKRISSQKQN
jgi:hypothetical protein